MKQSKLILVTLVLFMAFLSFQPIKADTTNTTTITDDGYIRNTAGVYVDVDGASESIFFGLDAGGPDIRRGYVEWDITGVTNETIVQLIFYYDGGAFISPGNITSLSIRPSISAANAIYWDVGNGTIFASEADFPVSGSQEIILNAAALANFQAALTAGQTWWGIGFINVDEVGPANTRSTIGDQGAPATNPVPTIESMGIGNYSYIFNGGYYENGTNYGPIKVTMSSPSAVYTFTVDGTKIQEFAVAPTLFYWDIGTASRRIYSIGSENFTVTYPESTFDTYVFTIRDFTGKTALGPAYLEAMRVINGTSTLIERQVIDVHNEIPLNLVVGATYTIRVRFFDGSLFNWGTYVPGDSTTFTIVLRGVEITEQAYLVGNFLNVEITRPITTQITVDYLTSRNTTVWSNVTVLIRNGAIIATQSYAVESFTYNLGGLDANTSYTVLVEGEHSLQTEWAYSKSFDGTETYPDIPNIENIFPMGALDGSNLIAWVFVLASGLVFSVIYKRASLIVMCAMASFFSAFGFTDWSIELLALNWFFAIVVYLGSGDR